MSLALNFVYALVATLTAPWWMRKARGGWPERFGRIEPLPTKRAERPRLMIHAVSVGEVNLTRPLIEELAGEFEILLTASTDTGIARASDVYAGSGVTVRRYPLDASWSVRRFLDAAQPDLVALVELELWPNFARACKRRSIPLCVINGRLSARSFKRYRAGRALVGRYFRQLRCAAVQDDAIGARFREMGVAPDRVMAAGSMKWDSAQVTDAIEGAEALAGALGIDRSRPLIVAGSSAPDEHELFRDAAPDGVQLLCAPRRPEWFDDSASVLPGCVRRTDRPDGTPGAPSATDRYLLDTIGELRMAYSLADIVIIGRSFGDLHGSDPMEAAALSKPVIIGPAVSDFATVVDTMRRSGAILQTDRAGLSALVQELVSDPARRRQLADSARRCVEANQGAAARHAELLRSIIRESDPR